MSNAIVSPSLFSGEVTLPPSKSDVHRAILCASLSKGKSVISPVDLSQDISATIDCASAPFCAISAALSANRAIPVERF